MKKVITLILIPLLLVSLVPSVLAEEKRSLQDELIYYVMIDRFSNVDSKNDYHVDVKDLEAFHGGDFVGIIERLDHIEDLGMTTITLNPIFANADKGYHGYWVEDFYETEEHFGTLEEFKRLVEEAHKRDINVMIDFPLNYVAATHPWVNDPTKSDWLKESEEISTPDMFTKDWLAGLPQINYENEEAAQYIIEAAKWWITETGVDGYRLEGIQLTDKDFLESFVDSVKETDNEFFVLGEVWSTDPQEIAKYEMTGIDSLTDYASTSNIREAFVKPDVSMTDTIGDIENNIDTYEEPNMVTRLIDSKDMIRFTNQPVALNEHPGPRWRTALTYLFTTPGIPMLYYGSEIALIGNETPDNRRQMDFRTDPELIEYIGQLTKAREKLPSIAKGDFTLLHESEGFTVFKRQFKEETSIVAINNTSGTKDLVLTGEEIENDKELRGLLAGGLVRSNDQNEYHLVLDREEAEIYVLTEKQGFNFVYGATLLSVLLAFFAFLFLARRRGRNRTGE